MRVNKLVAGGVTISALAFSLAVAGIPANAQSLQDALAATYTNNPELLAQRAEQRAVDEGVPQALANWRPNVTLSGDVARTQSHLNTRTTTNRD